MTRTEIETEYQVLDGRIKSPGKFEGEPSYVPAFWDDGLNGFATEDNPPWYRFDLTAEDLAEWPELADYARLYLREDDQGFVHRKLLTAAQVEKELAEPTDLTNGWPSDDASDDDGDEPTTVAATWAEDKDGEYVAIAEDGAVRYMAHGKVMELIITKQEADEMDSEAVFANIRDWMEEKQYWPNIWSVNDHGNVTLYDAYGKDLGGLV